jgi:DNA-binding PadR family transcriptional regulator
VGKKKKLSLGAVLVLHALARGRSYGFDIMMETGLSGGTIYPALDRLEELGFVVADWEDVEVARAEKRPPRRNYRITPEGARELQAALERHRALAPLDLTPFLEPREG